MCLNYIIGVMLGLLLVVLVVALVPVPGTTIMGDVNNDGRITVSDAQSIARVSSGLEASNCASDLDRNGRTNILDALKVAQIAVGTRFHSTGTCDDPSRQFVCGDVNADARVTQRDADDISQAIVGAFVCDDAVICPSTGLICDRGNICYPNAPVGFEPLCGDSQGTAVGDTPNGILTSADVDGISMYLSGIDRAALSYCFAPCRDPRTTVKFMIIIIIR